MSPTQPKDWHRLDNAAIMFPSASSGANTRVFRFTCELCEDVDPSALQAALDETVKHNPGYVCTIRSGLFWHYLESSSSVPRVHEEKFTPCFSIYNVNKKTLLFYVSYYRARINVEFYHALTDGTGASVFIQTLVIHYLRILHPQLRDQVPVPSFTGSLSEQTEDSFGKHYSPTRGEARIKMPRALQIKGRVTSDNHYVMLEGVASASQVVALARSRGTTVTGLLCAIYMRSIAQCCSATDKKRPVVITVPFNLRNIFPSMTMRNFFVTSQVSYDFSAGEGTLEELAALVTGHLKSPDTRDRLIKRMDSLVALQRNPLMRAAPLFLKDIAIGISKRVNEAGETAVLSNVSKTEIPQALEPYIKLFSATSSTSNMHLCVLTFKDSMAMTFSSRFRENEVARRFFQTLTEAGVGLTVSTNYNQG